MLKNNNNKENISSTLSLKPFFFFFSMRVIFNQYLPKKSHPFSLFLPKTPFNKQRS